MATDNPTPKLCECGCGQPTLVITRGNARLGRVKGQLWRFRQGHHRRLLSVPQGRYVRRNRKKLHISIAETVLGKPLPPLARVHHVNGDTLNNAHTNLVICQDQAYHLLLHARARVFRAGGNPNTQALCCWCHRAKLFTEFYRRFENGSYGGTSGICKECRRIRDKGRWRKGSVHGV